MHMSLSKLWKIVKDKESAVHEDHAAVRAAVHEVTKSRTQLSNWTITKYVCFLCHLPATAHRHRLCVPVCLVSRIQLFAPLWTVTHQAPLSMGFSRQVYWSGLPFPSPGDLPDPGIEPESPYLAGRFSTTEPPGKPYIGYGRSLNVITILWRILKLVVL